MTLPLLIVPPETATASFSFTDIADGTGIQIFFCAIGETSGGNTYHLLSEAVSSKNAGSDKNLGGGSDVDFDTAIFNLPRTAKGTAFISGTFDVIADANIVMTARIVKWDGSTETNISSVVTSQTETATGIRAFLFALPLTQTIIKKGDLLRVTITVTEGGNSVVHADPLASATDSQPLRLLMPFKLDL